VAHPFQNVFVRQVLLGTITGKEVSEGMEFALPWVFKAALLAQTLQISS
jgi:hypothetical protein